MNTVTRTALFAAFIAATGAAWTVSASAADASSAPVAKMAPAERKAEMEKHRQEMFKHMSDRMADRLEIKPSQQAAFQAYTTALQTAMTPPANHPEYKSDAAGIARMNADLAAEHAKRLAAVADATAKFQEALSPEQRKTFDQMAAAFMHHHHGMHRGFGHERSGDRAERHFDDGSRWDHGGQWDQGSHGDHHDGTQHD
jgi:hypothetical protein